MSRQLSAIWYIDSFKHAHLRAGIGIGRKKIKSLLFFPLPSPFPWTNSASSLGKEKSLLPRSFKGFGQGWGSCTEHNHSSSFVIKENWCEQSDHSTLPKRTLLCRKNHYTDKTEVEMVFLQFCHTRHWPSLSVRWTNHWIVFPERWHQGAQPPPALLGARNTNIFSMLPSLVGNSA